MMGQADIPVDDASGTSGSGVGLCNAKIMVNAAGGDIKVDSQIKKGTSVTFTFEIVPQNSAERSSLIQKKSPSDKKSFVEDSSFSINMSKI